MFFLHLKGTLYTVVTKHHQNEEFKRKPEHGCLAKGLYLEGAQWDSENNCLKR